MKKILTITIALLLGITLNAQKLKHDGGFVRHDGSTVVQPGVSYSTEFQAVIDEWTSLGYVAGADTLAQYDNMLTRILDTCNVDAFWFFAVTNNDNGEALVEWINPGVDDATAVNTITFTKYEGVASNGTDSYIDLNYNASSDATYYSLNSGTVGWYVRTNINDASYDLGARDGSNYLRANINTGGDFIITMNSDGSMADTSPGAGMWIVTRTASDAYQFWVDNVSIATDTDATTGIPNLDLYLGTYNLYGSPSGYDTNQFSALIICEELSDQQRAEVDDAIRDMMTYLGKAV